MAVESTLGNTSGVAFFHVIAFEHTLTFYQESPMDPVWIAIAFILGFAACRAGLPPLVGYLVAGFALNVLGIEGGDVLQQIADLGVTLLLFTIGLKLDLKKLLKSEVWASASLHMLITVSLSSVALFALSLLGIPHLAGLDVPMVIMIAFALSFSSTVFAVKTLEEKAQMASFHGRVVIGILILQDIFAVFFLTLSTENIPSLWSLALPLLLWAIRPLLFKLLERCGHGEILLLFGLFAALVPGAMAFDFFGLKPDLGALVLGVLLAGHQKSSELAKSLMELKDLFLIGFFLTIGLSGVPDLAGIGVALLLLLAIPLKSLLFLLLLTRFRLRSRSALLGSLCLASYSEFGLIVAAVCSSHGWIEPDWLVIIAIVMALSFIIAAPLNSIADTLYARFKSRLIRLETPTRHPDDQPIDPGEATISIFGMGRLGTVTYDFLREHYGNKVLGFDFNPETVKVHKAAGRRVILGDPTDPDFWERIKPRSKGRVILLAMPKHAANLAAARQFRAKGYKGPIAAMARYDDETRELREAGVDMPFNLFAEAGSGFAEHVWKEMKHSSHERGHPFKS